MIKAALPVIAILALATSAHAWVIRGGSRRTQDAMVDDAAILPACARAEIAQRLHKVFIADLTDRSRMIGGEQHTIDATSWKLGFMVLSPHLHGAHLRTAYLHELGHFYAWATGADDTAIWRDAVRADFAAMPNDEARKEAYLRNPSEAFAELFAAHYLGERYYEADHYDPAFFPRSQIMIERTLCEDEEHGR